MISCLIKRIVGGLVLLLFGAGLVALNNNGAVMTLYTGGLGDANLRVAAEKNNLRAVAKYIFGGMAITNTDSLGRTAAAVALANGNFEVFYHLTDVEAFFKACEMGNLAKIKDIIVAAKGTEWIPVGLGLLRAAECAQFDVVEYLIETIKVDVNFVHPVSGATALMLSAERGYSEIAEYLLKHGAEPDIKDVEGSNALFRVLSTDSDDTNTLEMVKLLIEYKADVHAVSEDNFGEVSILAFAVGNSRAEEARALLEAGAHVDEVRDSKTLLHRAARWQDGLKTIKVLIKYGVDIDARDANNQTALDIAVANLDGSDKVVRYLRLLYAFHEVVASTLTFENFSKQHLVDSKSCIWLKELLYRGDQKTADLFYEWMSKSEVCKKGDICFKNKTCMYAELLADTVTETQAILWYLLAAKSAPQDGLSESIKVRSNHKRKPGGNSEYEILRKKRCGLKNCIRKMSGTQITNTVFATAGFKPITDFVDCSFVFKS